jgi:hypothetical protein
VGGGGGEYGRHCGNLKLSTFKGRRLLWSSWLNYGRREHHSLREYNKVYPCQAIVSHLKGQPHKIIILNFLSENQWVLVLELNVLSREMPQAKVVSFDGSVINGEAWRFSAILPTPPCSESRFKY